MTYVIGVDGGGSNVRVVVVTPDLRIIAESQAGTANPNVAGREQAAATIQAALRQALEPAGLSPSDIAAAGLGIGGAEPSHSAEWVRSVARVVLPTSRLVVSHDSEIALVGAHGERRGILILSGTGSLSCGVGAAGEFHLIGGKGYRLSDEGSGYWIGMEGLRAATRDLEGRGRRTALTPLILTQLELAGEGDLVPWLYHSGQTRVREIAALARLVLAQAEQGDWVALDIVERASAELALLLRAIQHRLHMEPLPIAFAGSLLTHPTPVSRQLCARIGLADIPPQRHPPTLGAAILALNALD